MIKNIVLDIGNVLIPFSWRQHLDHFGFSDEIKKRLADAVFLMMTGTRLTEVF